MNKIGAHLFIIYELEQIHILEARIAAGEIFTVIALEYELELEMKKRDINFVPLRSLATSPEGERAPIEATRFMAREWYALPEMKFFKHDGIKLAEQYEAHFLYYIQALVYYFIIIEQAFSTLGLVTRVVVPKSFVHVPETADPMEFFKGRLPVDVAQLLAKRHDAKFDIITIPALSRAREDARKWKARALQVAFRLIVAVSNALVEFGTKSRPLRVLASDPWSRIESIVAAMPDVELIMTRRKEIGTMGIRAIMRTRTRFYHRLDFADASIQSAARVAAQDFARCWDMLGENISIANLFTYNGISFWPVVKPVLESLVKDHSADAIATIESTKRLLARCRINIVLLFASTKGYNNILARVAERMDIPGIELQHALLTMIEPDFVHSRLPARYLAGYGPLIRTQFASFGIEPSRILLCGSPRFDSYAKPVAESAQKALRKKLRVDEGKVNVVAMIPHISLCLGHGNFSSYAVEGHIEDLADLQKNCPDIRYLLRPRPGHQRDFYNRPEVLELFPGEIRVAQNDDLRTLLSLADLVISGNSSLVLEAMLAHKPVLMYVPRIIDSDFQAFEDAGAIVMARTRNDLTRHAAALMESSARSALVERSDRFLEKQFVLDGKSSIRIVNLLREVSSLSRIMHTVKI